ncbi:MAG: hypothetical protein GY802_22185 [Gammaproteobacteria bacterium]|nr:hypothetical protein [Gammaproteobacteria bacterium]
MPLTEAGFHTDKGIPYPQRLLWQGPTLEVIVRHMDTGDDTPEQNETVGALVDTGATISCIDRQLAEELELPIVDQQEIAGVGGSKMHPVYKAQVHVSNLDHMQYGPFILETAVEREKER